MTNSSFTPHSLKRMNMRRISKEYIDLCIKYGEKIHRTGITFYVLLKKNIRGLNLPKNLEGLCVLIASDNVLITAYKNKNAISDIKKLNKQNLKKFKLCYR